MSRDEAASGQQVCIVLCDYLYFQKKSIILRKDTGVTDGLCDGKGKSEPVWQEQLRLEYRVSIKSGRTITFMLIKPHLLGNGGRAEMM